MVHPPHPRPRLRDCHRNGGNAMRRLDRNREGITVVIVTIGMSALILMAALALDMGALFVNAGRNQNGADATALAAAANCADSKAANSAPLPTLKPNEVSDLTAT